MKIKSITFKGVEYRLNEGLTVIVDNSDNYDTLVDYINHIIYEKKDRVSSQLTSINRITTDINIITKQEEIKNFLRNSFSNNIVFISIKNNPKDLTSIEEMAEYHNGCHIRQRVIQTTLPLFISNCKPEDVLIVKKNGKIGYASEFGIYTYGCEPNDIIETVFETELRNKEVQELIDKISEKHRLENIIDEELYDKLLSYVGPSDKAIIRINHARFMLNRKNRKE
jgi:hypothetical protein